MPPKNEAIAFLLMKKYQYLQDALTELRQNQFDKFILCRFTFDAFVIRHLRRISIVVKFKAFFSEFSWLSLFQAFLKFQISILNKNMKFGRGHVVCGFVDILN